MLPGFDSAVANASTAATVDFPACRAEQETSSRTGRQELSLPSIRAHACRFHQADRVRAKERGELGG